MGLWKIKKSVIFDATTHAFVDGFEIVARFAEREIAESLIDFADQYSDVGFGEAVGSAKLDTPAEVPLRYTSRLPSMSRATW